MASKRFIKNLVKYLIIPVGFAIGMSMAIVWSSGKIVDGPRLNPKYAFPVDSLFIDLDRIAMDKKGYKIDSVFTALQLRAGFNGTVLYAEKGRLVFKNAYGYEDFKTRKRLTTQSAFQLASVSKMFTAMAIMILQEDGLLDYDDSLELFIPGLPYPGVTIRHLLIHRSGIPDYMYFSDEHWGQKRPISNENMIWIMQELKPPRFFSAGNGFDYCNSNYALLASVVEHVTGKAFEDFLRERIFGPLEMHDSFLYRLEPGESVPRTVPVGVPGHRSYRGRAIGEQNFYQNGVVGDKGIYSTVEDLFKFDQALYNGLLVSEETLMEAFTPGSPRRSRHRDNYGFGWRLKAGRSNTIYHYGWWKGFRTYFIRDMEQEKTIIVLTNTTRLLSSGRLYGILDNHQFELGPISAIDPKGSRKSLGVSR